MNPTDDLQPASECSCSAGPQPSSQTSESQALEPMEPPLLASPTDFGPVGPSSHEGGVALQESPPALAAPPRDSKTPATVPSGGVELGTPIQVNPSCAGDSTFHPFPGGQKVFVLGRLYYDFGTEARRDYFVAQMRAWWERHHPDGPPFSAGMVYNPKVMVDYLFNLDEDGVPRPDEPDHMDQAPALIWTIYIDQDPVYALVPEDQYAVISFIRLLEALKGQVSSEDPETYRISIAGTIDNQITLLNGTVVPKLAIVTRAIFYWDIEALLGSMPSGGSGTSDSDDPRDDLKHFLLRIYYELRNLGVSPDDRAKNFAATNAYQARRIFEWAIKNGYKLDSIAFADSPICRKNSICRDIRLTFFDPKDLFGAARVVYEYTIDVSDLVPVQVGDLRRYEIFGGPNL